MDLDRDELLCLQGFVVCVNEVMNAVPLPVPPRPGSRWDGDVIPARELYLAYSRLPARLQAITAESYAICVRALEAQRRVASAAQVARIAVIVEIIEHTGLTAEQLFPDVRLDRGYLSLVRDPPDAGDAGDDSDDDEVLRREVIEAVAAHTRVLPFPMSDWTHSIDLGDLGDLDDDAPAADDDGDSAAAAADAGDSAAAIPVDSAAAVPADDDGDSAAAIPGDSAAAIPVDDAADDDGASAAAIPVDDPSAGPFDPASASRTATALAEDALPSARAPFPRWAIAAGALIAAAAVLAVAWWPSNPSSRARRPPSPAASAPAFSIDRTVQDGDLTVIMSHGEHTDAGVVDVNVYMVNAGETAHHADITVHDGDRDMVESPEVIPPRSTRRRVIKVREDAPRETLSVSFGEASIGDIPGLSESQ